MLASPAAALNVELLPRWSLENVQDVLRSKCRVPLTPTPFFSLSGPVIPYTSAQVCISEHVIASGC